MNVFGTSRFRLLRLAAQFRETPRTNRRSANVDEVVSLADQLMNEGIYTDEFDYICDPDIKYSEMLPIIRSFLNKLNWRLLEDKEEFRFMTALYSDLGQRNDVFAYHAMLGWMEEVGHELEDNFHGQLVADGIGAGEIYGGYYTYSNVTGGDLIPSVGDPAKHDWNSEGMARPKKVFAEWLANNPDDFAKCRPIDIALLDRLRA